MQNAKKVAILGTRGVPARYGGFETFAEELGARLAARGFSTTVFCLRDRSKIAQKEYRGIQLKYVSAPRLGPLNTILFDLKCLWQARRGYDVVYMLGYGASLFCFIPRLWGTQVWLNMDGVEWARSKWSWLAKLYLRLMESMAMWAPNRIIADADAIKNHLKGRHHLMPACSVIPYGAQITEEASKEPLREWGLKKHAYYIVVCRLEPENHVVEILKGYLASRTAHPLVVVGDEKANTAYVRTLHSVSNHRIIFVGTVYSREKLRALRFYAIAYFHGHSVGGTNPSLLEAMACGNATIAHDNVFNREVAGNAAVYFQETADIPLLMAEIESVPERRASMRCEARRRIMDTYDWDSVTAAYEALLR
jgi:glycosyltransferase involved in cell wall biosynthesis